MSFSRRSFRGFKLPAQRPPVEQTPSRDDGASTSAQPAQGSGSGDTVHTPATYRPTLPDEPRYQSPHSLPDTQYGSLDLSGMPDFDTPSPTQMAGFFNEVVLPNISGAETQHPDAEVLPRGSEGSQGMHEDAMVGPQAY
jgi:hypothetical protein